MSAMTKRSKALTASLLGALIMVREHCVDRIVKQ